MVDFNSVTSEDLNIKLRKFYAEAQPKDKVKRENVMSAGQAVEYHKNTLKNIRAALNRHLHDIGIGQDVDIVKDKQFKTSDMLDSKLKFNVKEGISRSTKHKQIIVPADLEKISTFLNESSNPVILRFRNWLNLSVHFVSRGLEFHQQLNLKSFKFSKDENNCEYVTIVHETKQKNHQGGVDSVEAPTDKRMYATNDTYCPVEALRSLIAKTRPDAKSLFNNCSKDALNSPNTEPVWYTTIPVKQYQFTRFMADISRQSKTNTVCTAHCLRATSIQAMSDAGFEMRHIMFMSGHRSESAV
ncbi:uncharacterized protein LOC121386133 [Gigantopelta aegis]|uniref:uncharacterized protein LOC121386133 n=1 Tax=Gigantopelta aegis TaxID=1735272 RepID=UPI001B888487|nr:uncharacterized protein LOC121386133 [Gigantopelta aegis]